MKGRAALLATVVFGLVLLRGAPAQAQEKPGQLGLGFIAGTPLGASAKYMLSRDFAADFALGAEGGDFDMHSDLLVHLRDLLPQPQKGKLPFYLGLGFKIRTESDTFFGLRFVGGASYLVQDQPIEFFAEIAPVLRLAPSPDGDIDGGVGVRYYFGLGK